MGAEVRGQEGLFDVEDSLDELEQLAHTVGVEVVGRDMQRLTAINPSIYIGSGKLEQLRKLVDKLALDLVLFDFELTPAQLRNLEKALEVRVLDRTALILDIFAMHARTREGALQVELAQYIYRRSRLTRQWTHLSRQAVGGVGLRGPGEMQLEVDRREIDRRMAQLRRELEQVRQQRTLQRRRRQRTGIPVVGIVGYTNAGKSTLLNRLAGSEVYVENILFATLDPTIRRVLLPSGREALFSDTVGFIQKLPTELVAAFRATLEEVQEADILLHVVDAADSSLLGKVEAVEEVLDEIGASKKPTIIALNKIDLVDPETELEPQVTPFITRRNPAAQLRELYDPVVPISAQQGVGTDELLQAVDDLLVEQMVEVDVTLPYSAGDLLNMAHQQGVIEEESYQPTGVRLLGRLPKWVLGILKPEDPRLISEEKWE